MTKYLITGSRTGDFTYKIEEFLLSLVGKENIEIIHGGAPGVDSITETKCKGIGIPTTIIRPVRPDINTYYLHRNAEMIGMCDEVVAFWDGQSRGTKFTIDYARARNKKVIIVSL